jgi:hypothetical protein
MGKNWRAAPPRWVQRCPAGSDAGKSLLPSVAL